MENYRKKYEDDLRSGKTYLDNRRSIELLQSIHYKIRRGSAGEPVISWQTRLATIVSLAAMLLLCVMVGWLVNTQRSSTRFAQVEQSTTNVKGMTWYTNNNDSNRVLTLQDGSEVTLYPGSNIRVYESFTPNARAVQLSGKARFQVAKDARRPFSVYANDISTTAIGTCFEVDARNNNEVSVNLLEGKVVVQSLNSLYFTDDIYLHAGERFSYNRYSGQLAVTHGDKDRNTPKPDIMKAAKHAEAPNDLLEFVQEPMLTVFNKLSLHYKTGFEYDSNAIKHMQVTGSIKLSDPLDQVLMILETVNNIKFRRTGNTIIVESSQ